MSKLEAELAALQYNFLAGDSAAIVSVWGLVLPILAQRAAAAGCGYDEARDIAADAILYVQGRGNSEPPLRSLMAALNQSVDWHMGKAKYHNGQEDREFSETDLNITGPEEGSDEEEPEPLLLLEERRMSEGYMPHEYLTTVTMASAEDIVLAENMREFFERVATEQCGTRHWHIYHAVIVQEKSQSEVAEAYDLSQQRVSEIVQEVASTLKGALLGR